MPDRKPDYIITVSKSKSSKSKFAKGKKKSHIKVGVAWKLKNKTITLKSNYPIGVDLSKVSLIPLDDYKKK